MKFIINLTPQTWLTLFLMMVLFMISLLLTPTSFAHCVILIHNHTPNPVNASIIDPARGNAVVSSSIVTIPFNSSDLVVTSGHYPACSYHNLIPHVVSATQLKVCQCLKITSDTKTGTETPTYKCIDCTGRN